MEDPYAEIDGTKAVVHFERDGGYRNIRDIQHMTQTHILKVQKQCSMADDDFLGLENTSGDRSTRLRIEKEHSACLVSIRAIDKPNVHLLQELVFCTLPMLGHVSRVAELVLEKAHQTLKRAIKISNEKEVHSACMNSAAVSD